MRKELSNKINNECGGASSTQKIDASEMQLEMCDVTFAQNATAKSKCELGALQAMRDKTETQAKAATEGLDPAEFMKAYASMILGVVAIVVVIIIVIIVVMFSGGSSGGTTSGPSQFVQGMQGMQGMMAMPPNNMLAQGMKMMQNMPKTGFGRRHVPFRRNY
jgi:hypothetical protein